MVVLLGEVVVLECLGIAEVQTEVAGGVVGETHWGQSGFAVALQFATVHSRKLQKLVVLFEIVEHPEVEQVLTGGIVVGTQVLGKAVVLVELLALGL